MKNFVIALAFAVTAIFVSGNSSAVAQQNSIVWHHGTPMYVGKSPTPRTHGSTYGARQTTVLRNWYQPSSNHSAVVKPAITTRRIFRFGRRR